MIHLAHFLKILIVLVQCISFHPKCIVIFQTASREIDFVMPYRHIELTDSSKSVFVVGDSSQ